jgi:DNA-binding NarL/FixJ family response regulator
MAVERSRALLGRTSERNQFGRLLDTVRSGESGALVVRGEAGIGKTALLDHYAQEASGFRIARIASTQSEMELPFAGLHQLCSPMLGELDNLPDAQQNALQVAFGLSLGDAPDSFLVALATLSLLAEVAQKRPLLCLVDDAQWLDAASAQALGFVARRLVAESVLVIFALRDPTEGHHFAGLPERTLHGLSDDDARALLVTAVPGRVDPRVRDRVVAESRGNPLALLELPRGMTAAELAGFAVPRSRDLPGQLEEHYLRRIEALPGDTQRLMLVAAADPTGDVALLWRVGRELGIGRDAAADLDTNDLIEIGEQVRFIHPLVRSAIYAGASAEERRAVHSALAAALDPQIDPDRRAWHRALAVAGSDEEVASELEQSASRARARGGLAAAAALLRRSVSLTQDLQRRVDRALVATQAEIAAGAFDEALRLLGAAEVDAQNELQRARIDLLRGQISLVASPSAEASVRLLNAARRLEPLDVGLARETYLDAWGAAIFEGRLAGGGHLSDVSRAARMAPSSTDPMQLSDLLLDGLSLLVTEGLEAAIPTLRKAVSAFRNEEMSVEKGLRWGVLAGVAAADLWDFESMAAVMRRQTELARSAGALAPLCFTLNGDVFIMAWRGELTAADVLAAETDALSDAIGIRNTPYGALLLAGLRGDEPHSSTVIERGIRLARERGEGVVAFVGLCASAVLSNGLARYEQALSQSLQASEDAPEHFFNPWTLPELIEAAVRTGNDVLAIDALERLVLSTGQSEGDWARGVRARCRALVNDGEKAEEHYREAIECFSRTSLRPDHARSHLLYGEWLRRQKRRTDARVQLRAAYDMFGEIGMIAFAERAVRELRATGETVRKRDVDTRSDLTPQEEQIARLAIEGRTNPEIGAQMYISARTVEWHLAKVFTKLGIASRRGLRDALPAPPGTSGRNSDPATGIR